MLIFSCGVEPQVKKKEGDLMSDTVAKPQPVIPIAGFKDVYDVPAVEKALHELPAGANEGLRAVYEKMLRLGGQRFTVKPSALPDGAPVRGPAELQRSS